ncbi:acireductone synthase [Streptomyces sp. ISL-100]|uniref:acireductone synthase n=1 Tax=Streptomyces sp. ISL-100 TaxID=2819173 RepID=UPI001BEBD795|nr:acireductone synthase [Streptomyces sp. ISL-100]MBT2399806.1 acireductone synthase [Streptomyces sp. ISL-100]
MPAAGPGNAPVEAVVLDIEGTTGSLSHVRDVLFPYARERLDSWAVAHRGSLPWQRVLDAVRAHIGAGEVTERDVLALLHQWADADAKAPPLKTVQGLIWAEGYASGELHGHVYAEVPRALEGWKARGMARYIYSSGSEAAQRDWFGHTAYGDLRDLLDGYFDLTSAGPKTSADSYRAISGAVRLPASRLLFVSDVGEELDAAAEAGWRTAAVRRPGDERGPVPGHEVIASLDPLLSDNGLTEDASGSPAQAQEEQRHA